MAVKNTVIAGDYKGYIDFKNKKRAFTSTALSVSGKRPT